MGSSWTWTVHLPDDPDAGTVETLLALAETAGFGPHRPDGAINAFPCHEPWDDLPEVDFVELVEGLVDGRHATNLWNDDEVDAFFHVDPGGGARTPRVSLSLLAAWAYEFPHLHQRLTTLWTRFAEATGAMFGRVDDEYSVEQIWHLLADPLQDVPPAVGHLPFPMGWWNYFDAERVQHLPPLPASLRAVVHRTTSGGAVISLLDDHAAVDVLEYERIHLLLAGR